MSKAEYSPSGLLHKMSRTMLRDERGTVAIEFAIMAPIMILLTVGIVDLGSLLMKYRHAVQAAASLAQVGAHLSIQNRDETQGVGNTITNDQSVMLKNGLKMVFGENDALKAKAMARRVIRTGTKLNTDWTWSLGDVGKDGAAFPLNTQEIMSQTASGESIMVVDVSFKHQFIFSSLFGKESQFTAHYLAGVPSY